MRKNNEPGFMLNGRFFVGMPDIRKASDVDPYRRANARVLENDNLWSGEGETQGRRKLENEVYLQEFPDRKGFFTPSLSYHHFEGEYRLDNDVAEKIIANCPDPSRLNVLTTGGDYFIAKDSPLYEEVSLLLANHPVLDDDILYEVERETILDYWKNAGVYDLENMLADRMKSLDCDEESVWEARSILGNLDDDEWREVIGIIEGDGGSGEYSFESGGNVWFPVRERLGKDCGKLDAVCSFLEERYTEISR